MTGQVTYFFGPPILDRYTLGDLETLVEKARSNIRLKKVDLDIIRFLAVNGSNSCYSMYEGPRIPRKRGRPPIRIINRIPKRDKSKALAYDFKKILRHADKLVKMGLLQYKKPKRKEVLALTFDGFHIYLQNTFIQEPDKEARHLDEAITANSKLLPFARYWNEIVRIVGKKTAYQSVAGAIKQQIFRNPVNIGEINLKFDSFLIRPRPIFPKISKRKHDIEVADFISRSQELRDSYIAYLAVHDIFYLTSHERLSEIDLNRADLESEKALDFLERRNTRRKLLLKSRTRLREFFPRFATIECFFTGMLMEKLLWKEWRVNEISSKE